MKFKNLNTAAKNLRNNNPAPRTAFLASAAMMNYTRHANPEMIEVEQLPLVGPLTFIECGAGNVYFRTECGRTVAVKTAG